MIRGAVERPSKARCQSGERIAIMTGFKNDLAQGHSPSDVTVVPPMGKSQHCLVKLAPKSRIERCLDDLPDE
jgi:hypothetical protein